jgi:UDP-2,3-diacylglucosamine pyrophosphatase LpxH
MEFLERLEFSEGGRKFRIKHGDQYGDRVIHYRFLMNFLSLLQDIIEFFFDFNISDWLTRQKLKRRKLRRIWDILKWNNDADVFIMGHSHTPEAIVWIDENENIKTYINSGDWVSHSSYVEITDGVVRLRKYERKDSTDKVGS